MVDCLKCGRRIPDPSEAEVCASPHEDVQDPVLLHVDCGCPEHGWDGDRHGYSQDNFLYEDDGADRMPLNVIGGEVDIPDGITVDETIEFPKGAIPFVRNNKHHRRFVDIARPDTVLTDILSARQLVKRGETADSYFGEETDVIVTSTVTDEKLSLIPWDAEFDAVVQFEPEYHIPTDYSIYAGHSKEERIEILEKMYDGISWTASRHADTGITVIPQIKGFTLAEREVCYRGIDELDAPFAAFYGTQHFTGPGGNARGKLADTLTQISSEVDINLFVIGLLSPQYLERLPDSVVAAAGENQWRKVCEPSSASEQTIKDSYGDLEEAVRAALGNADG